MRKKQQREVLPDTTGYMSAALGFVTQRSGLGFPQSTASVSWAHAQCFLRRWRGGRGVPLLGNLRVASSGSSVSPFSRSVAAIVITVCLNFIYLLWSFSEDMDIHGHPGGRGTMQTVPDKVDMSLGKKDR